MSPARASCTRPCWACSRSSICAARTPSPAASRKASSCASLPRRAWYPTALLPSQGVHWTAVDDNAATATMRDGSVTATLLFRFDARTGLVESARAEARGRTLGKAVVMTPWEGRWSNYVEHDGLCVPTSGEVAWLTPQGRRPYWRGERLPCAMNCTPMTVDAAGARGLSARPLDHRWADCTQVACSRAPAPEPARARSC